MCACVHACVRARACMHACVRACVRACVTGGGLAHWRMKNLEINRSYISPRQDCSEHNIVSRINFPKVMHCGIDLAADQISTKQPIWHCLKTAVVSAVASVNSYYALNACSSFSVGTSTIL